MRTTVYRTPDDHISLLYTPYASLSDREATKVSYPDLDENLIERIKNEKPDQVQKLLDFSLSSYV